MPDMYAAGEYDLAGFCVGAVERKAMIDGKSIRAGDVAIGVRSSGPHSNGYSLIRKVLELAGKDDINGHDAGEILLTPTRIYVKSVLALMQAVNVKGLAHITGGGITENLPRILEASLHAEIDASSWDQGPVFDWLANIGNITTAEMRRTFNCGVGMIVVVDDESAGDALGILADNGEEAWIIGRIADGAGEVRFL